MQNPNATVKSTEEILDRKCATDSKMVDKLMN